MKKLGAKDKEIMKMKKLGVKDKEIMKILQNFDKMFPWKLKTPIKIFKLKIE